jgi:pseudaminic acid cytidylyltransferase
MSNLAVILARADSKRIPNKNMRKFNGKPVIQYSIEAAQESGLFEHIIVSTDSQAIGSFAARLGAINYQRDEVNATDDAPMVDALIEAIEHRGWDGGSIYDNVCMIYACAPFIKIGTMKRAFDLLPEYDVVFPIFKDGNHSERSLILPNGKLQSRHPEFDQTNSNAWPDTYQSAGQFYVANVDALIKNTTLMPDSKGGVIIPETEAIDIDTPDDWLRAELIYNAMHNAQEIEWTKAHRRLIKVCETMEKVDGDATLKFRDGKLVSITAKTQTEVQL